MPRLPSFENLGDRPSSMSGRPTSSVDTTAVGEAMMGLGRSIDRASDDLGRIGARQNNENDQLDLARANAHAVTKDIELRNGFRDDDPNYDKWGQQYREGSSKINTEGASLIRNPSLRERWQLNRQDDIARNQVAVEQRVKARANNQVYADTNAQLETIRRQALESPDVAERQKLIGTGRELIAGLQAKGIITPENARKEGERWVQNYAKDKFELMPAQERVEALRPPAKVGDAAKSAFQFFVKKGWAPHQAAGIIGNLIQESSMNTGARNAGDGRDGSDSIGIGQWNSDRAARLKRYAAARGTDWRDFQTQLEYVDLELRTSEGKAGNALTSAKDVREATAAMVMYERPAGSQRGAEYADGWKNRLRQAQAIHHVVGNGPVPERAPGSDLADFLSPEDRMAMLRKAETEVQQGAIREAKDRGETWERVIIDASGTGSDLPPRSVLENDGGLDEARRNTLLKQYDTANKEAGELRASTAKFADPQAVFDPHDSNDKKAAERVFNRLGGDLDSLQAVVDRTNIVPESAGKAIRSALISNDAGRVSRAMTISGNLLARNPNIFAGVAGASDIENAATSFKHYTERFGMSAEEAAQRLIKEQAPEYKNDIQRRAKAEDAEAILKKEIVSGKLTKELRSAFDESWFSSPDVEFAPEARNALTRDYADLTKDRFLEHGDMARAKEQAILQLKKTWGVSYVNGTSGGNIMRYPPDRAPAHAGIENIADEFANQVIGAIKFELGQDVERGKLMIVPTPGGQTAQAYTAGEPVPYSVSWLDKNGNLQMLNPGKAFVFDPEAVRGRRSNDARLGLQSAQAAANEKVDIEKRSVMVPGGFADKLVKGITDPALPEGPIPDRPPIKPGDFGSPRSDATPEAMPSVEAHDESGRVSAVLVRGKYIKIERDDKGRFIGFKKD